MHSASLLSLLHLCDSLFPTGGFAHSDGLEAATAAGRVSASSDLRAWMDVCLDEGLARVEGPAVWRARQAWSERRRTDLDTLNAEVYALRPSSAGRSASRAMGARLIKTWQEVHPERATAIAGGPDSGSLPRMSDATLGSGMMLPVAFGVICAAAGIDARSAVEGFIYTRLAATASSALRLMSIGQREAHVLLAATLARVPLTVDAIEAAVVRGDDLGAFTPAIDIAMMGQQYVRSRLFLS